MVSKNTECHANCSKPLKKYLKKGKIQNEYMQYFHFYSCTIHQLGLLKWNFLNFLCRFYRFFKTDLKSAYYQAFLVKKIVKVLQTLKPNAAETAKKIQKGIQ